MSQYASQITGNILVNLRSIDGKLYNCTDNNLYKVEKINHNTTTLSNSNTKFSPSSIRLVGGVAGTNSDNLLVLYFKKKNEIATKFTLSFWWYQKDSIFSNSSWIYCGIDIQSTYYKNNYSNLYIMPHLGQNVGFWTQYGGYNNSSTFQSIFSTYSTHSQEPLNTWVHYAVCRNDNTIYFFKNGVLLSSKSKQINDMFGFNMFRIIRYNNTAEFYVDDAVYIENQALWTSNFTPPNDYLTGQYTGTLGKKKSVIPNYVPFYQDKAFIY